MAIVAKIKIVALIAPKSVTIVRSVATVTKPAAVFSISHTLQHMVVAGVRRTIKARLAGIKVGA